MPEGGRAPWLRVSHHDERRVGALGSEPHVRLPVALLRFLYVRDDADPDGSCVIAVWSAAGAHAPTLLNPGVKQAMFGAIGVVLMLVIANTDYRFIGALAWPAYFGSLLVLMAVKVLGVEIAGSRRWFDFGF